MAIHGAIETFINISKLKKNGSNSLKKIAL